MLLVKATPYEMDKSILDTILDTSTLGNDLSTDSAPRKDVVVSISHMGLFKSYMDHASERVWDKFLNEEAAENFAPQLWKGDESQYDQRLRSLLLLKLCRMDRFVPAAEAFVTSVFGSGFFDYTGDLKEVVDQVNARTPIALTSNPGFDASYKVDALVERVNATCASIAMGSNESLAAADKAISNAAASGNWVLVKNVHLTPQWLQSLEKRIGSLKPHADFRLFLSTETSPKIPANLIRASRILMYEQPAGIRANMKDSLSVLAPRAGREPVEKGRLYLLLCFLHAVAQERLRYTPALGWKGFWEFNDSDVSPISTHILEHQTNDVISVRMLCLHH